MANTTCFLVEPTNTISFAHLLKGGAFELSVILYRPVYSLVLRLLSIAVIYPAP